MIAKIEKTKHAATVTITEISKIPENLMKRLVNNSYICVPYDNGMIVLVYGNDVMFDLLMEEVAKYTEIIVIQDNSAHWIGGK